jgi:hypothetical protein
MIPAGEVLACGTVTLSSSPTYMQADRQVTSYIRARVIGPDGKPASGTITFSIMSSPSSRDRFSRSTITVSQGVANAVFYHYPSKPGTIRILAVAKIVTEAGTFYPTGYAELYAVKLELVNSVKYIAVGSKAVFTAKVSPEEVRGQYLWKITRGTDRAQISSSSGSTSTIKGISASQYIGDVNLNLVFIPQGGGPTDWIKPVDHSFTVWRIWLSLSPNIIAANSDWPKSKDFISTISINIEPKAMQQIIPVKNIEPYIKEITGGEGYDTGPGSLKRTLYSDSQVLYLAFIEPKYSKHPKLKNVKIAAKYNGEDCCTPMALKVLPIFDYFKNRGDYTSDLRYVEWKYDLGGPTGSYKSSIPYFDESANTDISGRTYYGLAAFSSENDLAAVIIHEGVHRQATFQMRLIALISYIRFGENGYDWAIAELSAYSREYNERARTEPSPGLLGWVTSMINDLKKVIARHENDWNK